MALVSGYDPGVNPTASSVFATSAFLCGLSLVGNYMNKADNSDASLPSDESENLAAAVCIQRTRDHGLPGKY